MFYDPTDAEATGYQFSPIHLYCYIIPVFLFSVKPIVSNLNPEDQRLMRFKKFDDLATGTFEKSNSRLDVSEVYISGF